MVYFGILIEKTTSFKFSLLKKKANKLIVTVAPHHNMLPEVSFCFAPNFMMPTYNPCVLPEKYGFDKSHDSKINLEESIGKNK